MNVFATTSAVTMLNATLGAIPFGVQQFSVFPGPTGDSQAVAIALGDMTKIPADAFVVPHFNGEESLGGVGAAIVRSGALPGIKAYERFLATLPRSPKGKAQQNWGDATTTDSGGGLSKYLINVVSVGGCPDINAAVNHVAVSTIHALEEAQRHQLDSVVFPALGTGIIGDLSDSLSAYLILGALTFFRVNHPNNLKPSMITIAIYGDLNAYEAWVHMLETGPLTKEAKRIASQAGGRHIDIVRWNRGMELMNKTIDFANGQSDDKGFVH